MPTEVPTFNMPPERRDLTGHEIEQAINLAPINPEATIDIYEDTIATPPEFFAVPPVNHEVVQAPAVVHETPTYMQGLERGVENTPKLELIKGISDAGRNLAAVRQMTRGDYTLIA